MCDENIEIGVTEITNNILVSAQPTDQIIDINVLEEVENVELTITPSVVEVNIDVTQELITEIVTVDANTCVNIVDVTITDATDNVTLNITPSLVEVNINRGENNLSIEEYETFFDLPTIGDTDTYYITLDENKFWRWDNINEVYVEISPSSAVWGSITGTLNDQIDLRNALNAKQNQLNGNGFVKASGTTISYDNTTYFPFPSGDTTQYIAGDGSLISFPIDGQSGALVRQVRNATGATLAKGTVVYVNGAIGNKPSVAKALATSDVTSAQTFGLVQADIPNNSNGYVICYGDLTGLDTQSLTEGAQLYLSSTTAGAYTTTKQYAPNHLVYVGVVTRSHPNQGQIEVRIQNGYEMDELHNVSAQSPSNKDGLFFNSSTNLWEKNQLSNIISATTPLSFASNVLSISQANATTDGYLSSTDWNYFSAKQQPLNGTGFVKATGSVISYDNTVYTPQSRTLTINGTAYDLSADRSWSISVGSGMRNVSSFVATSGQTTFTIVGGYTAGLVDVFVNGARLNAGDYTATNGTTIVLGTGVVANDIVDIINYTASLTSGITGSGTANYIPKWSGSSNLTNSILFNSATGIGVNTTTPRAAFEVNGYAYSGGFWTTDDSTGGGFYIGNLNTGESYSYISGIGSVGSTSYIAFHTYAEEAMRIKANGYVGIGVSNPAYQLEVGGDINITGSFRINGVAIGGGSGTVTGTGTTNYIAKWSGSSAIGNSQIFDNGTNVGIGTASPSAPLTVLSDNSNAYTFNLLGRSADNASTINFFNNAGSTRYGYLYNDASGMYLGVNASTRLFINTSGNIGIGTTSPSYKLDVSGTARFTGQVSLTNNNIIYSDAASGHTYHQFNRNTATGWEQMIMWSTGGTAKWYVGLQNNTSDGFSIYGAAAGANAITILANNNVAIGGTTAPQKVTITASAYPILGFNIGTTAQGYIGSLNGGGIAINSQIAQPLMFFTNDSERMRIQSNGDVAIGTTSSGGYKLAVNGSFNAIGNVTSTGGGAGLFTQSRDLSAAMGWYSENTTYMYYYHTTHGATARITGSSGAYTALSDINKKKDIEESKLGLEAIKLLKPKTYRFKSENDSASKSLGFIAQEVKEAIPQAYSEDGEFIGLTEMPIIATLVNAVKELSAKVELLEAK